MIFRSRVIAGDAQAGPALAGGHHGVGGPGAVEVATFKDRVYGFVFKAANKSTVWYNVAAFEDAGAGDYNLDLLVAR